MCLGLRGVRLGVVFLVLRLGRGLVLRVVVGRLRVRLVFCVRGLVVVRLLRLLVLVFFVVLVLFF